MNGAKERLIASSRSRASLVISSAILLMTGMLRADDFQGSTHLVPFEEDPIRYNSAKESNVISRLQERMNQGTLKFKFDERFGYLPALLEALHISTNSQMLVFSQTSFQRERIRPKTPRSLYFNDDVYVGFIPGAPLIEISTTDPKLGGVFYTIDQSQDVTPRFARTDQCLECHASAKTMGVPGHLVRSFQTDENGVPDLSTGVSSVNHRTPLADRWGGWFVTGEHGSQPHRGNLIGKAAFARQEQEPNYLGNQTNLNRWLDTTAYPAESSDIVALMVLEHQAHLHNFITRLQYESALALQSYGHLNYLKNVIDGFLRYLLFTEETQLTAPLKGSEAFARSFSAQGRRDGRGRSLRDFDLQTRLFKYPCSYLIYSDSFDKLPEELKTILYQKLYDILTGRDTRPEWSRLPAREAIREILVETKPGLPAYWRKAG